MLNSVSRNINMKKSLIVFLSFLLLTGCVDSLDDYNVDTKKAPTVTAVTLFSNSLKGLIDALVTPNVSNNNYRLYVQQWAETTYLDEQRYNLTARAIPQALWQSMYRDVISDLTEAKKILNANTLLSAESKNNQLAQIEITEILAWSVLVNTFGDVPYSESMDPLKPLPKFDDAKTVYYSLLDRLDAALLLLNTTGPGFTAGDLIYKGDIAKWRKFGNSLYLRLLLRLSGKSEVSANCIAKIKEIVETNPTAYPIMASNDDAAVLRWTGVGALTSPFIGGVREQDWRAPDIAEFFINNLNRWADPRLTSNRWSIATYQGGYVGVPSGYAPGEGVVGKSYFQSTTSATTLMSEPLMGNIMNYSELQFILAEAAAKGWLSGSAGAYYNNAVLSGITFWIPTFAIPINTYLASGDMVWDDNATLGSKMEMIHVQKYYSLFWTDMEQWFEYRRTGYPVLPKGNGLRNNGIMPARLTYPVYVQSANADNYKAAVASQGADEINTQVWWQKP